MTTAPREDASVGAPRRALWVTAAVIVAVSVAFAGGLLAGSRLPSQRDAPGEASIDAGFARDMQAHHRQAVQMSTFVLDVAEDAQVKSLARDILLTQQQQVGQMYGWLATWRLAQSSTRPALAWMPGDAAGMAGMAGMQDGTGMAGMASQDQLEDLQRAVGPEAERLYLQLMLPHHQGGVAMAQVAAAQAGTPAVRRLAQSIVDAQTAELQVLRTMLDARGGPVGNP